MNEIAKPLSEMTLEELWQLFPIILSSHNPDWKNYYEEEKALLEKSFGDLLVRIEHIGSTAVEGLIAKPTVDILLEVYSSASSEAVRQAAERMRDSVGCERNICIAASRPLLKKSSLNLISL